MIHKILEILLLQSLVLGKKRDNSTDTYLNIINKNSDLCQVCGKGSKADGGKKQGQYLITRDLLQSAVQAVIHGHLGYKQAQH